MGGDAVGEEGQGGVGTASEESRLWAAWREQGDAAARERLIHLHYGFARIMAGKLYARRPTDEIGFDEYLQLASVGLIESVDRFDPGRGASFRTFSSHRIQGAILSGLEASTERARQLALKRQLEQERLESLSSGGEAPRDDAFARLASIAIGLALGFMLEDVGLYRSDEEAGEDNTYASAELRQMKRRLLKLVGKLPEREAKIIREHYFQQVPFDEIAASLGLSKGRVSQIHHRALAMLREAFQGKGAVNLSL